MTIAKSSKLPPWMWMSRTRQKLSQHIEAGTSELAENQVHHSKTRDVYFDAARDAAARAAPYPMVPSMALPPGHAYSSHHPDGTPVFVYRDATDFTTKAYVNACRHRGSPLVHPTRGMFDTIPLKSPLLTCPYHAWSYDARDGALKGIPGHEKAFCKMDKTPFSLHTVTCKEDAGMVWVGGDRFREKELWNVDEVHGALEPFLFDPAHHETNPSYANRVVGYREWELAANWQLLVETALESYHVKSLHQKTLHKVTHPTWAMVSEWMDRERNFRMTVPLRNMEHEAESQEWSERDTQKFLEQTSTTHLIFPMTFISFFKRFVLTVVVEPLPTAKDNSTISKIRAWGLPHRYYDPAVDEDGEKHQERDFQALLAAVEEDWNCTMDIQRGLDAHASDEFIYGGYEGNNVQFLKNVGTAANQLQK